MLTTTGILVKCDASIKAMLVDIDSKSGNEYIIEKLDEEHILVKETRINELKARLNQVGNTTFTACTALTWTDDEGASKGAGKLGFRVDLPHSRPRPLDRTPSA